MPIYISMMMMNYKKIQPEVIVGLGDDTDFQEQPAPFTTVTKLHLKLEDWLGDDLMECYPCYIVTEYLKNLLETQSFKGFEFQEIKTTLDDVFENNYQQNKPLPEFYRLQINGQKTHDDLFLDDDKILNASTVFLDFIRSNVSLKYLEIAPEKNEFDDLLDQMIAQSQAPNDKQA